jgi:hypothetical protein
LVQKVEGESHLGPDATKLLSAVRNYGRAYGAEAVPQDAGAEEECEREVEAEREVERELETEPELPVAQPLEEEDWHSWAAALALPAAAAAAQQGVAVRAAPMPLLHFMPAIADVAHIREACEVSGRQKQLSLRQSGDAQR